MIYGHRQLFQLIGGTPRVIVTVVQLGSPPTVMIESFDWQNKHGEPGDEASVSSTVCVG